ncbi:hypothetical protein KIN20_011252 [Parelaphostrongylus tenuis]|uniref:G-protein coupled receptors family 1 profile domain-containing protein n=1 Tax=Parelaphostrongylus tenuis TaxID=148309 RepID=A0AAD5N001_PARTN|nr:hypothetical protein KIN20_011252 [Parelaphostrongylus tenuis]
MATQIISVGYLIFYAVISTISIVGNASIVYVTIYSKSLRSICNIFIALISAGDILYSSSIYVMVISYNMKLYMTIDILLASLYALAVVTWAFAERTKAEAVVCFMSASMTGLLYNVFFNSVLLLNVSILVCYASSIRFLKKVRMSE